MEYELGTSRRIKDRGETVPLECPNCKEKVNFEVFTNMERHPSAYFPHIESNTVYFLVCPKCAGIFTVDESKGDAFKKGKELSIGNFDLKTLKPFKK